MGKKICKGQEVEGRVERKNKEKRGGRRRNKVGERRSKERRRGEGKKKNKGEEKA